jgi:hypothetical protein
MPLDVTEHVEVGENDGESCPILRCVCGHKYEAWDAVLSVYPDSTFQCDECQRQLYFTVAIRVFQVTD